MPEGGGRGALLYLVNRVRFSVSLVKNGVYNLTG